MMRLSRYFYLGCLIAGLGFPAWADQTDPRLDSLFARLKVAETASQVVPLEAQIWEIWLETPDEDLDAVLETGIRAMNRGQHETALNAFDRLVEVAPDFAEGWNKRATLHYLMRNFDQSLEDIERTLALEPRHFGALSGRGLVYLELDNPEAALLAFEAALEISPQMPGPRINAEAIRRALKIKDI